MGDLDKSGTVTLQELVPAWHCRRTDQASHQEGPYHPGRVYAEAIGGEGGVSGDVARDELSAQELTCIA